MAVPAQRRRGKGGERQKFVYKDREGGPGRSTLTGGRERKGRKGRGEKGAQGQEEASGMRKGRGRVLKAVKSVFIYAF
jgi:hypothetical protein